MQTITRIDDRSAVFTQWLKELTALPTAAGHEHRVLEWIQRWVDERSEHLVMTSDDVGNRTISHRSDTGDADPLYITAHLDHPAFVFESLTDDGDVNLTFRGTVRDPYFTDAEIRLYPKGSTDFVRAQVLESEPTKPLRTARARVTDGDATTIGPGTIGVWELPEQEIDGDGIFHTNACDDLAGVAAALCAMDVLRHDARAHHVRLLFTRAEEVGFIGTIGACQLKTIPSNARLLTLETSRSFVDSPIGAGPIVRVGDRLSTFAPDFTAAIAHVAKTLGDADDSFRWQRKLMAGGACEATAFCAFGFQATCVCLPLGNYHNQGDLTTVEAEAPEKAAVGREFIAVSDYLHLVQLLIGCGVALDAAPATLDMINKLYAERSWIITDSDA